MKIQFKLLGSLAASALLLIGCTKDELAEPTTPSGIIVETVKVVGDMNSLQFVVNGEVINSAVVKNEAGNQGYVGPEATGPGCFIVKLEENSFGFSESSLWLSAYHNYDYVGITFYLDAPDNRQNGYITLSDIGVKDYARKLENTVFFKGPVTSTYNRILTKNTPIRYFKDGEYTIDLDIEVEINHNIR